MALIVLEASYILCHTTPSLPQASRVPSSDLLSTSPPFLPSSQRTLTMQANVGFLSVLILSHDCDQIPGNSG